MGSLKVVHYVVSKCQIMYNSMLEISEYWRKGNIIGWPDICQPNRPKIFPFVQYSLIHDLTLSMYLCTETWVPSLVWVVGRGSRYILTYLLPTMYNHMTDGKQQCNIWASNVNIMDKMLIHVTSHLFAFYPDIIARLSFLCPF